ncbi:MAG: cell envelope integrity protein TolA [Planctomycetales bacterium]|nr:cell envelope integrity protein TolA [Planctomycetales bacterium]
MKFTRRQVAIGVSLVFHAALIAVLFAWYLPKPSAESGPTASLGETDIGGGDGVDSPSASDNKPIVVPESIKDMAVQQPDVSRQEIERSIESQIEAAEKLPNDRKLTELERNLRRLESVASEQSIDQVTSTVAESLGLDVNQYAPKETPLDGTFDTNTAQMSDVLRSTDKQGNWRYETVMVDQQGREMRVPLGPEEGAQLYETFELMKRYPMAKGVYQSVVMPMMQKMLQGDSVQRSSEPTLIAPGG